MPDTNDCTVFRIIAQIIPWILVVGGWLIANKQNNFREKRKETRAIINQLLGDLDTIEKQAYSYHQAQESSIGVGRDIKLALNRISQTISRENLLQLGHRQTIRKLRQAITLNNFDTDHFVSQSVESELLAGISASKDELVNALEQHFKNQYQS